MLNASNPFSGKTAFYWLAALCVLFALYLPSLKGDFIWDDDKYVSNNPVLESSHGLKDIWLSPGATPQYYPVTFSTFFIEKRLWGNHPVGYKVVNLIFHFLNAFLLFLILKRVSAPGAWLASALFLFHPVQVESVAWISERKNVLSAFFALLSLAFYFNLGRKKNDKDHPWVPQGQPAYMISLLCFTLGLLSKTAICALPLSFLGLEWWKTGKISRVNVIRVVPFFGVAAIFIFGVIMMERYVVGAEVLDFGLGFLDRLFIASRAVWHYLSKLVWPSPLIFSYERWKDIGAGFGWIGGTVALVALTGALYFYRRQIGRAPFAALVLFVAFLSPALGFIDFYPMRFSFVADHFQYFANVVGFAFFGALLALGLERLKGKGPTLLGKGLILALFGGLSFLTFSQAQAYVNLETLWKDTLSKNPQSGLANSNLGTLYLSQGHLEKAVPHLERALEEDPTNIFSQASLGVTQTYLGRYQQAVRTLGHVLYKEPNFIQAGVFQAHALILSRQPAEALDLLMILNPMLPNAPALQAFRAQANMALGQFEEADTVLTAGRKKWPKDGQIQTYSGVLALLREKHEDAQAFFETALTEGKLRRFEWWDMAMGYRMMGQEGKVGEIYAEAAEKGGSLPFLESDPVLIKTLPPAFSFIQPPPIEKDPS